jgi:hypothetical protein
LVRAVSPERDKEKKLRGAANFFPVLCVIWSGIGYRDL